MKISADMPLEPILDRMGAQGTSLNEAEAMRRVLAGQYAGQEVTALSEEQWLQAVGQMELVKETGDEGMR
ncbi:hypothetical protein [Deinococcus petrolearius]|uniref:Antitoxin VbhA domain-containing protein n=1 Tax=Deinococcus petrolearius TaxID=1751295 RepID=A0ABW1DI06_9DEIO